jgi:hypothetical protein
MLWLCSYEALPGVRLDSLGRRFLRQHDAGTNSPGVVRGWYVHPGGTSGVVFLELDSPQEVTAVIEPYSSLVSWRVTPAVELNYNQVLEEGRSNRGRAAREDAMSGVAPSSGSGF